MTEVGVLDYVIILLYFGIVGYAGYVGAKRSKTTEDYWVAGRRLGLAMFWGTLVAVMLGGAATIGSTRLGYKFGLSGAWMDVTFGLGIALLGVLLSTVLARLRLFSTAELMGIRYGQFSRLTTAIIMSLYTTLIGVIQIIAMGTIFHLLLGWDATWAMVLAGGFVIVYTWAGGMWAVTLTDILQFGIMTVGIFLLLLPASLSKVGGFGSLRAQLPDSYFTISAIGWDTVWAYILLFVFGLLVGQDIWQRMFSARNAAVARAGAYLAAAYCVALGLATALIGMSAKVLFPDLARPDTAFAQMATAALPVGLTGFVLAAVLAAQMSTGDSAILSSATLLTNDIYGGFIRRDLTPEQLVSAAKWFTLGNGLVALVFALWVQDILVALDVAYAFLSGSLFIPILGALFWKRATWQGTLGSIGVSAVVVIYMLATKGLSSTDPIMYGLPVSLIAFVAISLLTPAPSAAELAAWEQTLHARDQVESTAQAGG